jgi:hypothetical protein
MARTKKTAAEQKDIRLRKKFGIDLAEHDRRRAEQDGKCGICGGALEAFGPPCVDHYHFHVKAFRTTYGDQAFPEYKWQGIAYDERGTVNCVKPANTRAAALVAVKAVMMPWSVRGLLCFKCNRGLGYVERFFGAASNPDILNDVANYLRVRLNRP